MPASLTDSGLPTSGNTHAQKERERGCITLWVWCFGIAHMRRLYTLALVLYIGGVGRGVSVPPLFWVGGGAGPPQ